MCSFWVPEKSEKGGTDGFKWLFSSQESQGGVTDHAGESGGTTGHWAPPWCVGTQGRGSWAVMGDGGRELQGCCSGWAEEAMGSLSVCVQKVTASLSLFSSLV